MQIFESVMLLCFGLSWPLSLYKSLTSKTTKGKSVVFMAAIIVGYISGILGKLVNGDVSYVLALYCFNLTVVSLDFAVYFINRHNEKKTAEEVK